MGQKLSRRHFVHAITASAGAGVLAACGNKAAPTSSNQTSSAPRPVPPASQPFSVSLPRETFLQYLDATADTNMRRCHHCAQATFATLQDGFGLEGGAILKALTPLPGIAERGETCGAVVASLMALGLMFGRDRIDDWPAWRASLGPAQAFCAAFKKEFGSTQCGDLHERLFGRRYNLADPAELREFQSASPGPTELCGGVVRKAVRLAAEILLEKRPA